MLHAGEVLLDRYEILKMIGKGGMSTVYQARDLVSQQLLAVKDVDRSGLQQNQVVEQSLTAEGRMLKQLSNPHLPKIYDIIEQPEKIMLVMDYIQGESLDKVIARQGAQSVEQTLDWGMQICEVLHYLHSQPTPIIYRDMKPANVMLQPNGQLMLIDFGTARTEKVGIEMKADTVCIGTAGFAAPEQFGGFGQSTARTDIFCLGATMYNMVTGHSPCDRPTGILPLEQWKPELANSPISEIIKKCTRNDPDARYQTAMELHEDLRLASIGAYRSSRRGLSGNLWQKQSVQEKGLLTAGLSGILQRSRSGQSSQLPQKEKGANVPSTLSASVHSNGWQSAPLRQAAQEQQIPQHFRQTAPPEDTLLSRLILIAVLVAGIFAVLAVVLAVLRITGAAVVFLLIAFASAAAAVVGMILSRRQ